MLRIAGRQVGDGGLRPLWQTLSATALYQAFRAVVTKYQKGQQRPFANAQAGGGQRFCGEKESCEEIGRGSGDKAPFADDDDAVRRYGDHHDPSLFLVCTKLDMLPVNTQQK